MKWKLCTSLKSEVRRSKNKSENVLQATDKIRGLFKKLGPIFFVFFLGYTEINYQGENVQEVCTTTM